MFRQSLQNFVGLVAAAVRRLSDGAASDPGSVSFCVLPLSGLPAVRNAHGTVPKAHVRRWLAQ